VRLAGAAAAFAGIPSFARRGFASPAADKFGGPTPNADFYITSYGATPAVDASIWKLQIKGLVGNPIDLSYSNIKALPRINETLTLECISNPVGGGLHPSAKGD
jgi:DMSO/TMAO reductase YedYZ molybdopterin-dependent catalytic subunit